MNIEVTIQAERSPLPNEFEDQVVTVKMIPADFQEHLSSNGIVMEIDGKKYVFGAKALLHAVRCCGGFPGGEG